MAVIYNMVLFNSVKKAFTYYSDRYATVEGDEIVNLPYKDLVALSINIPNNELKHLEEVGNGEYIFNNHVPKSWIKRAKQLRDDNNE